MQIGIAKKNKEGQTVSGDSSIQIKLKDGKYLIALSDGMGSGPEARKSSQIAVKMLGRLLSNGFDKETSIELINNTILSNPESETYATLDTMILDLYAGNAEYIKNGAAPTFVKHKKDVDIISSKQSLSRYAPNLLYRQLLAIFCDFISLKFKLSR